jgi:PAS domain S-box-containing protein
LGIFAMPIEESKTNDEDKFSRYVHTLSNLKEGIAIVSFEWKYLYANEPYAKLMQMQCENIIGQTIFELVPETKSSFYFNNVCKNVMNERTPMEVEIDYKFSEDSLNWFHINVIPIPEGIFIQSEDITEKKLLFELAEYRSSEMKAILESIPDAIIIGDYNGITQCNSRALHLLGFDSLQDLNGNLGVIAKKINARWPDTGTPLKLDEVQLIRALNNEVFEENVQITNYKTGEDLVIRVAGAPVILNGKTISAVLVETDISDRIQAAEKLRLASIELEHSRHELANLNETKVKLFSIIAHDLRNPFQALASVANMLIEDLELFNKQEILQLSKELKKTVKIQFEVLDNLLTWVQFQKGIIKFQPRRIFLYDKLQLVIGQLQIHAQNKNIQIVSSVSKDLVAIGDMDMLQSVFQNIISNGIKFCNPGGHIKIMAEKSGNEIITSIKDNGIGMDEDLKSIMFTIDNKVRRAGTMDEKGTGLGLNLSKEMVEKQGGKIWLESEKGKGTTFYFTLPASDE